MSEQYTLDRFLAIALALLFLGMSASMASQQETREFLDDEIRSMNTHSNLNLPGSTVGSIYSITALGASYDYTCVVLDNNQMKCWGSNYGAFLGNSNEGGNEYTPVSVNDVDSTSCCLTNVTETSPDGRHTAALTSSGEIYAWGEDYSGQIGHGHISCFGVCNQPHGPSVMPGSRTFVTVATGVLHTCAITEPDMALWCWGENEDGQLGTGDNIDRNAPTQIDLPQGRHPVSVNAGWASTCVILDNGSGMCWGKNDFGHLGDGTYNNRNEPTSISVLPSNRSLVAMDLGAGHACGILDDGMVNCWGNGKFSNSTSGGRLGDGTDSSSTYPRSVSLPVGRTAISIDAGIDHTCAILDDSSAVCWGLNSMGQLGDGTTDNSTTPVTVSMPTGLGVAEISAGWIHTCAVATNASVYCWGNHGEGALGLGEDVDSDVPAFVDLGAGRHALMSERDNDDDGIVNMFDPFPDGCSVGTYATNGTCEETSPGTYGNGISPYDQIPCEQGTYQPSAGQGGCISTSPGYFSNESSSIDQTPCPAGTYQPDMGQIACLLASPGHYVDSDASTRQSQCSSGTYQPSSGAIECIGADEGNYVSEFASTSQSPCPPGTYQPYSRSESCFQANPGFHVPSEGSANQEECQPGTFSEEVGQAECSEAPPGYFVIESQQSLPSPCQPGEFQPSSGQSTCLLTDPGNFTDSEGSANQTPCPGGTYQPNQGQTSCLDADPGSYALDGATSQTPCPPGTFSEEVGQAECTPADPGNYVDFDGATGQTPCPPGQYQSDSGSEGCVDPPPGQIASPDGTDTSLCPSGKYKPEGQTSCIDASPGHFVNESGASSQTPCQSGTYQEEPGQTGCEMASPGSFVSEEGSTGQTPCPKGEFQSYGGQESCNPAMPGHHVPEAGAMSQTSCRPGNYQPDEGGEDCIPADAGNFVPSSGSTSQTPCQPGTYQPGEQSLGCQPSDPGNFVSEAGATEQKKCPKGQEQELSGQTGCTDIERPLWLTIVIFAVPAIVLGTMAVLYLANKKKTGAGGRGKAYMYSEDLRRKG